MVCEYVFVGENKSNLAKKKDWSWEKCQEERKPRLCAIQLFDALKNCGIDPYSVTILNLLDDEGNLSDSAVEKIKLKAEGGIKIVAMGVRIDKKLKLLDIEHLSIPHPASRGVLRRSQVYNAVVKERLKQDTSE